MSIWTRIIINYKQVEDIAHALERLKSTEQIVVVDNSTQDSLMHPRSLQVVKKRTRYVSSDHNLGFGSAANLGAVGCDTPWILFLNPDVSLSTDTGEAMVRDAESRGLDACCPMTDDIRYRQPLPSWWWFLSRYTPLKHLSVCARWAEDGSFTLWGGCLLVRKGVFEALGGFDRDFFMWFEDSDLTYRLVDQGFQIGQVAVSGWTHVGGASFSPVSTQTQRKWFFQSARVYARKHCSYLTQVLVSILQWRYTRL